jgi:hypothetical protein
VDVVTFKTPGPEVDPEESELKELKLAGVRISELHPDAPDWLVVSWKEEPGHKVVWKRDRPIQVIQYVDRKTMAFRDKPVGSTEEAVAFIKELMRGT